MNTVLQTHYNVNTAWFTYCNFFNTVHIQIASPASPSYLLANSIYRHILFPQSCQINFHCTSISQKVPAVPTGLVITVHFGPCGEDGSRVWEWEVYRGWHPHVQENLRHGSHEGHKKGDKPGRCASRGQEMQIKRTKSVKVLHSKPPGVSVETRWCIGAVH